MDRKAVYDENEAQRPFADRWSDWTKQLKAEDPRHQAAQQMQQEALDELNDALSDL